MPVTSPWVNPLPVRRVQRSAGDPLGECEWPVTLPSVAQLLRDGLDLGPATVLVGENGTGKSTIVEAIAMAYGMGGEGGSTGARHSTWRSESRLHESLGLTRGLAASRWGYFLRAETMHGLFTYLGGEAASNRTKDPDFHALSHGESFLAMLSSRRFNGDGFFIMDEPEAGLSFGAQLALVGSLAGFAAQRGTQVLVATHSPIIASLPGASILELDDEGYHECAWADLAVVEHYARYLEAPERYLRHLVE